MEHITRREYIPLPEACQVEEVNVESQKKLVGNVKL